ncbi:MAG: hypothetical protein NT062_30040 [Proteobacteria bacterium]|nr:hypothetical protein [Pseudomonadota bacterium]
MRGSTTLISLLCACGSSSSDAPVGDGATADAPTVDAVGTVQPTNGNPDGMCAAGLPVEANPVDVSQPDTVVGTGTADSCTFAALDAAITNGGVITFACGAAPTTIMVTQTMHLPLMKDTVIDGANKVTLDGGGAVQILRFDSPNFQALETRVTIQHLAFKHGAIAGSMPIPTAPTPCSQGFNDGEGGAIYVRDGNLTVIDALFEDNTGAPLGPDVGGGAIRMLGSKHGILVVGSTFRRNRASNGAAIGCLFSELDVYDSLIEDNVATGHDANNNDPTMCSVMNNGQNEIGSGGNGGALYSDGISTTQRPVEVKLCGDKIVNNAAGANAFGGGLFFTSNNFGGSLAITDTTMTGNTGGHCGHWTAVQTGSVTNAGTAVGTNARSITITNSTLQGVN